MRVRVRGTRYVLDREWFCKWFLGRRVWLTLGLIFHGQLLVLMNIGMFAPIMMSTYLFCFQGDEPGRLLRFFGRGLSRLGVPMPATVRRGEPPLPAEDRALPHHIRDGRRLSSGLIYGFVALAVLGIFMQAGPVVPWFKEAVLGREGTAAAGGLHFGWFVLAIGVIALGVSYVQAHRGLPGFARKLALVTALAAAYLWLMGVRFIDPQTAETVKFIRVAVNLGLVAVLVLQQVPWVHRRLAALGSRSIRRIAAESRREADVAVYEPPGHAAAPWAYRPGGRLLVGFIIVYHVSAIAVWEMPDKDSLSTFRVKAREAFSTWVYATQMDQQWGMFAPNPPRHNVFMRIVLTDENGEAWDMRTDVYARERMPIPWIWNDRMRKMNRRVIGGEAGKGDVYQKWYGRYLCREWARTHRGVMPEKVELFKVSYKMPPPDVVARQGWYDPHKLLYDTGREERQHVEKCATAIHGQLPDSIRERHGLPPLGDVKFRGTARPKLPAWEKRNQAAAKATKPDTKTTPQKGVEKAARKTGLRKGLTKAASEPVKAEGGGGE
jgi:hypothetical protein